MGMSVANCVSEDTGGHHGQRILHECGQGVLRMLQPLLLATVEISLFSPVSHFCLCACGHIISLCSSVIG